MDTYLIYTLSLNGAVFYIGKTTILERRLREHKINYGKEIVMEKKDEYYGSLATASVLEDFWIKKYADLGIVLKNKNSSEPKVSHCGFCGKDVIQTSGKREKVYCSNSCRAKKYQKHKKKVIQNPGTIKLPKDFIETKKPVVEKKTPVKEVKVPAPKRAPYMSDAIKKKLGYKI